MLSNIINSKSIRNEILDFIVNILKDVNEKVVLNYFNKLTPKDIESHLLSLEGWKENDNILSITYKLSSFMEVMSFANLVSDRSEKIDHHPKIIIDYDTIVFELTTHSVEGLTLLDIRLANFIHETFNEIFTT